MPKRRSPIVPLHRWSWAGSHAQGGRTTDQDCCAVPTPGDPRLASHGALLVLCDGEGGGDGGEVAAAAAVKTTMQRYYTVQAGLPPHHALSDLVTAAHADIIRRAIAFPALGRMATTLVAALVTPQGQLYTAHAGDSRAYQFHDGQLKQLTSDHRLFLPAPLSGRNARAGELSRVVTRSLGVGAHASADIQLHGVLPAGARIVLCSDGVHGAVSADEIRDVLMQAPTAARAQQALLEAAVRHRTPDNISAIVFDYGAPALKFAAPRAARWGAAGAALVVTMAGLVVLIETLTGPGNSTVPSETAPVPVPRSSLAARGPSLNLPPTDLPIHGGVAGPGPTDQAYGTASMASVTAPRPPPPTQDAGPPTPTSTSTSVPGSPLRATVSVTGEPIGTVRRYSAPPILGPSPERRWDGPEAPELSWRSVGDLTFGEYYRVAIRHAKGTDLMCLNGLKATPNPYVRDVGAGDDTFVWTIDVVRSDAPPAPDSRYCVGVSVSPASQSQFIWSKRAPPEPAGGAPSPAPTPCAPTPTRRCT